MVARNVSMGNLSAWVRGTGDIGTLFELKNRITAALAALDPTGSRQLISAGASAASSSTLMSPPNPSNMPGIDVKSVRDYIDGVQVPVFSTVVSPGSPNVKFTSSPNKINGVTTDAFASVVATDKLRAYLATDSGNNKEFTVASVAREVVAPVFSGSGLNDATAGGTYSGSTYDTFLITISTAAGTDKFDWTKNGSGGATAVSITGGAQTLSDGVTITFGATTGHTLTDNWTIKTPVVPTVTESVTARTSDSAPLILHFTAAELVNHNKVEELATLLAVINLRFA